MMTHISHFDHWKGSSKLDLELRKELLLLTPSEIKDSFSHPLEFGTGGLRGKMGVGIARINVHTIMQATEGFALYLKAHFKDGKVAISYDNRKDSKTFAITCARVLGFHGIHTLVFESLRPTPMLSFAVRHFQCIGGIMITASHNPKEDNGFKAYNHTGAQLNLVEAEEVIAHVSKIKDIFSVQFGSESFISYIDESFDALYEQAISGVTIHKKRHDVKIVYSPLHGTGGTVIPKILRNLGYHIIPVADEMIIDPNFTHTSSSNPEQPEAYLHSLETANQEHADLVLITDPDADRLGVAVLHNGSYTLLSGNQTAAIELFYLLSEKKKLKTLPQDGIVYTTVVTSHMIKAISKSFNIKTVETLTGFKFIGEQAELNDKPFIFGCEESYGSLILDVVRDKDAIQACMFLSEIASVLYPQTLVDYLDSIYKQYGYYKEAQDNFFFRGVKGKEVMDDILQKLRENPLDIPGFKLERVYDYQTSTVYEGLKTSTIDLPQSNVVTFVYDNQYVTFRPSGTEPKLKLYYGIKGQTEQHARNIIKQLQDYVTSWIGEFL